MGTAAELVAGAEELALDGAGGGLLAVGDLGVAEADGLQREVVALAACERLEALAGVEAVGDLVGQLGAGRCGLGQLAGLAGVREKTAGGLLALAGRAVTRMSPPRAAATRAPAGPGGPGAGALGRGAARAEVARRLRRGAGGS